MGITPAVVEKWDESKCFDTLQDPI